MMVCGQLWCRITDTALRASFFPSASADRSQTSPSNPAFRLGELGFRWVPLGYLLHLTFLFAIHDSEDEESLEGTNSKISDRLSCVQEPVV
jgi:hypothetical protein